MTFVMTAINAFFLAWLGPILLHQGWAWAGFVSVFASGLMLGMYLAQEALFRGFDRQRAREGKP